VDEDQPPAVELRAFVRGKRLRFEEASNSEVRFFDDLELEWEPSDEGLADEEEPEPDHGDVRWRWWEPAWRRYDEPDEG
jgi:hypothetical protein